MCIRTKKPLLASGCSMMSFFYLSATDLDNAIEIINKDSRKKIGEVLNTKPQGLNSMLIDPVTGDLYDFSHSTQRWLPKINSGLHYKQLNEFDPIYKHINPKSVFTVKAVEEDYPLIKGVNVEAFITLDNVGTY